MLMDSSLMGRLPIQPLEAVVCQSHHHHYYTAGPRDALLKESGGEREGAATAAQQRERSRGARVGEPSIVCYHSFFSCCLPAWPVPDPASLQATQAGNS